MVHSLFSIIAPLPRDIKVEVRERDLAFGDLGMVHFASVVVFDHPAGAEEGAFQQRVVLESAIDGDSDDYIAALVFEPRRRAAVAELFRHSPEFDEVSQHAKDSDAFRDALAAYLAKRVLKPQLFHIGNPGQRVAHIRSGDTLRRALDRLVATKLPGDLSYESPLDIARRLRDLLRVPPSVKTHWHLDGQKAEPGKYAWFSDPVTLWTSRIRHWGTFVLAALLAAGVVIAAVIGLWRVGGILALVGGAVAAAVGIRLLWKWVQGSHAPTPVDDETLEALTRQEDLGLHNHMASLTLLKPGLMRQISIRVVLGFLNLFYRTWFTDVTPGKLAGLPTIHFAQWSIVQLRAEGEPRREALLFLSNYDGSWELYLDDFLEFLFHGVVAIWGNAVTFPSPLDGRIFKQWARTRMTPHKDWLDKVYPTLAVPNIQNNNRLRLGLLDPPRTDHEARLWLGRLGAVKRGNEEFDAVAGPLPLHDVQGLVLRGYGGLPHAAFVLLHIEDGDAARQWIKTLAGEITDARELNARDRVHETHAVNVAFTHHGLQALELPASVLERFPHPFRKGMAPLRDNHRSRILGDLGDSAPAKWRWGGRGRLEDRVDVLLMLYGRTPALLNALVRRQADAFNTANVGHIVTTIISDPLTDGAPRGKMLEHFGFVDGLSQPRIEGTWQATDERSDAADLLKPGEFILGYQGGDGSTSPGVPVEAAHDPRGTLAPAPGSPGFHDFGRNGTFLVARQLMQDVAKFRRFTAEAAGVAPALHASSAAEHVAARLVGRWRSGTPLVQATPPGDLHSFSFATDPHGFGCPIGAHVRRANPRDSLGIDGAAARTSANRHRLLRRGRPYGPPLPPGDLTNGTAERGMMFVALNADIERQFEFVQQNWINNPVFGGLYAERDPVVGAIGEPEQFTVQANAVCQRIDGMSRFVSVVGGGYFFMPGISALRYLAHLEPLRLPQLTAASGVAMLTPPRQSRLRTAFAALGAVLPWVSLAWAIRFPLLLASLLVILPFSARWLPTVAPSFFFTGAVGAALIAYMASTAAWAAMVMLRLVLMYGTRVGLQRPRWTGPARWVHVLGTQALALPVVIAAIHYTARDLASPVTTASYWQVVRGVGWPAAAGMVLGLLTLGLATAIQSIRPGSRPELFSPPFPILPRLLKRASRTRLVQRTTRLISSLSERIVGSVPEEIGVGYIDYRRRRLLPGHAFAAVLAGLVFVVYVAGFFLLNPSRRTPLEVPSVAYLLFMSTAIVWLLSAASFFLDRYRIPTLLTIVAWLLLIATLVPEDHIFEVADADGSIGRAASPAEIVSAAAGRRGANAIVIASEGYALASAAWTAEVLTRLAADGDGRQFADAVRLISASSGATLATTHFVDAYTEDGFGLRSADRLENIRVRARTPSSAEGWWGLVYPDLVRAFAPVLVPARADRGWAMEQAWRRAFPDGRGPALSTWRRDAAQGWRPAIVFGVTGVETGEQGLLASYLARTRNSNGPDFVTAGRDIDVITAARLSAGFPYVSPIPRPGTGDPEGYHFTDGGFWDNSGVLPAIQWIEDAGCALKKVLLIEVRTSPGRQREAPETRPWTLAALGPLRTLVQVRYDGHAARTEETLQQFMRTHPVERVTFELRDPDVGFTWNLGRADVRRIEAAWNRDDIQLARDKVRAYLAGR